MVKMTIISTWHLLRSNYTCFSESSDFCHQAFPVNSRMEIYKKCSKELFLIWASSKLGSSTHTYMNLSLVCKCS